MGNRLKSYFNLLALDGLPDISLDDMCQAGYNGVQFASPASRADLEKCRRLGLEYAGSARVNKNEETKPLAEKWASDGFVCATLHVGWGFENQHDAAGLIESILEASITCGFPLYVETHRATIFQDMWRTVEFVRQFPDLRFNGDFSHWYTGQEMVYGGFENKLRFIEPVLERVRFIHGRIGTPGCIQVRVDPGRLPEPEYVTHFRQLWTACFRHGASIFTPELLAPKIYYARTLPDGTEESDRWEQSLVLKRLAEDCWRNAHD